MNVEHFKNTNRKKKLFVNNCFLCPTVHSWSYNYMLWSICVPYIDLPGIFTVCHQQWSARITRRLAACVLEKRTEVVVGAKVKQYIHYTFCEPVKCQLHFEFILSGLQWQGMLLLLPNICPKCELHRVLQSNQLFTPDTFTDIRAADTDILRDVWQIKEASAKTSRRREMERWNWGQKKEGEW